MSPPLPKCTKVSMKTMSFGRLPDGFDIPAGGSVALAPGGKHVMLMNVKQPLIEGESIAITLRFEHADPLSDCPHSKAWAARLRANTSIGGIKQKF